MLIVIAILESMSPCRLTMTKTRDRSWRRSDGEHGRGLPASELRSYAMDAQLASECLRDVNEVVWVAGHDHVVPCQSAHNDRRIDDVPGAGACAGGSRGACSILIELLDPATSEESRQLSLRSTTPSLTQDAGWNDGSLSTL